MYKSPIDIIYGQMQTQMEGDILKAVMNTGINVDKEELIRALRYDRDQYDHGFADGHMNAQQEAHHEIITYIDNAFNRSHGDSYWVDEQGKKHSVDVGYGGEWWEECMKPELLRVFDERRCDPNA